MTKKKGLIIAVAAAIVLAAVVLLLIFLPKGENGEKAAATIDEGVEMSVSTDKNGVHQAVIGTDKSGKIANNSYGTLMEYVPADIKQIHVENTKGSFDIFSNTPEGQSTVYTIKGYEDFDLQGGNPDTIASAAAKLEFSRVATLDKNRSGEFGFDKPRAKVTVSYNDNTKSIITVGNDAPQQAGTYVKFGTEDTVYVVDTSIASVFDYGVTDLISLTINNAADNTENNQPGVIRISGGGFDKEIELVPNDNENYSASYRMTAPVKRLANEGESSLISGGIRGLYAETVKMVNPGSDQLSELGLAQPNARLIAEYPDIKVDLIASKPDSDGMVCLMANGGKIVYTIAADKVPWCQTSYEKLCGEYICNPKMTALTGLTVTTGGKTTGFTLQTKESVTTDNEGSETAETVTTVSCGGKEVALGDFSVFYDALSLIPASDSKQGASDGTELLAVTYTFAGGGSDSVRFVESGGECTALLNGESIGHCPKADVTRAAGALAEVVK